MDDHDLIEKLISKYKQEGEEYYLSGVKLIYWILLRIFDYFEKPKVDDINNNIYIRDIPNTTYINQAADKLEKICLLLKKSSLFKDFGYNTFEDLIIDIENNSINIILDRHLQGYITFNIKPNLELHNIIDILKKCQKIRELLGGKKSRHNISKMNKISKNGGRKGRMINIKIKTKDNIVEYNATFNKNDYVLSIKNNILNEIDIKIENQRITFLGNELDNYQTLSQSGLVNGSTVIVEDTTVYTNLSIKLSLLWDTDKTGNYYIIIVSPDSTILDLKKRAASLFKINLPDIELSDGKWKNYDDEQILSELGLITNESIVYVDDKS
jgi:hypothetical protein